MQVYSCRVQLAFSKIFITREYPELIHVCVCKKPLEAPRCFARHPVSVGKKRNVCGYTCTKTPKAPGFQEANGSFEDRYIHTNAYFSFFLPLVSYPRHFLGDNYCHICARMKYAHHISHICHIFQGLLW